MYCILVYDIEMGEGGAKAARNIFKICKKYLTHIQKSVFEGEITEKHLEELCAKAEKIIDKKKDSIIIFKIRQEEWLYKDCIGKEKNILNNIL